MPFKSSDFSSPYFIVKRFTCLVCVCSGFGKEEKAKSLDDEVSAAPQSAFLGPTLWDKTLAYDGDSFQLEYMDLEEFLSENGIPSSEQSHQQPLPPVLPSQTPSSVITSTAMPPHRCVLNTVQPGNVRFPSLAFAHSCRYSQVMSDFPCICTQL